MLLSIFNYFNFENNSFKPISDLDRPFSIDELKRLNDNKLITIGNHTSDHAILNNLLIDEARNQIEVAQKKLEDISKNEDHFKGVGLVDLQDGNKIMFVSLMV